MGWILPHEFGSDTVATHAAGEKEAVYYIMRFSVGSKASCQASWKMALEGREKRFTGGFMVVRGWGWGDSIPACVGAHAV